MKRIFLLVVTNLAVMLVLSITASVLGINRYLTEGGLNLGALLVFAGLFGFGGAFISLAMSKWIAKFSTGAQVIEHPANPTERWLLETVRRQSQQAGIGMPEVAVYASPEVNAFATGMSRNNALVAVSEGLLHNMSQAEVEAVLAHEISHVANGDMVTMTLLQGILNTFVIFISRVVGYVVDRVILKNENGPGIGYYVTSIVCELLLGVLASLVVMWFSRQREFRADAGGARLAGRQNMIAALRRLQMQQAGAGLPGPVQAFGIAAGQGGWRSFLQTHPPLEARIEALQRAQ